MKTGNYSYHLLLFCIINVEKIEGIYKSKNGFLGEKAFSGTTKRQIANLLKIRYSKLENLSYSVCKGNTSSGTAFFPGFLSVGADRMDIP